MNAKKVLIVCFANICRSPTAESIFHQLVGQLGLTHRLMCDSAGCSSVRAGEPADNTARKVAEKHGYSLEAHIAKSVKPADADRFDYIVAVDTFNLLELREIFPEQDHHKLSLLLDYSQQHKGEDVPDPYRKSKAVYEKSLSLLEEGVEGLVNHLRLTYKI